MSGIIAAAAIGGGLGLLGNVMGSKNATQTLGTQNTTEIPQWITNAGKDTWQNALDVSTNMRQPTQLGVAPITQGGQSAISFLGQMAGYGQPQWQQAQQTASRVANYDPTQGDIQKFYTPFEEASRRLIDQQGQIQQNRNADLALKSGAFAGSRFAGLDAMTNAQTNLFAGQLGAQNYKDALAAAFANQQLNLQGAGAQAQFLTGGQNAAIQGGTAALSGQDLLRQNQQDQYAAQKAYEDALRQDPVERQQVMLASLGKLPYGQSSQGSQQAPTGTANPFLAGAGGAMTGLSMAATIAALNRGGSAGPPQQTDRGSWLG